MPDAKVAPQQARVEFVRLCKARRVAADVDSSWPDAEQEVYAYVRDVICNAITIGQLEIDGDDDPVLIPSGAGEGVPARIKFRKAMGTTLLSMDGKTGTARQFAAYAGMSEIGASHFGKLQMWDLELLAKLYHLFFQQRS